jgi:hypothetical protein
MLNVMHGKIVYNTSLKWKIITCRQIPKTLLLVTLDTDSELDSKSEEDDL